MKTSGALRWYLLAGLIVMLDQITKYVALNVMYYGEVVEVTSFFNWVLVFNTGAAFSFLSDAGGWQRWFFTGFALLVSVWIMFMLRRHAAEPEFSLPMSLLLGGALGNVIDRARIGAVVDFIQLHAAGMYWPAFNLADSAIVIAVALLLWQQLFTKKPQHKN